ncbi:hybrid sensor histidine kinase/response regulator [Selenomonas ruminantium]|uniref:hybrid sensor histidine kinase/response regulator n=1 Tax=Selenomonas ruminantium TaxID=971 RepID=UPI0015BF7236|nr:hybrid sensor histidine kinase/response regulator [Selenomonas ruminantium]
MFVRLKQLLENKEYRTATLKNMLISVVIILFFVGIILSYYTMLYNEKRTNIIKHEQMSAWSTADQVRDYLAVSMNAIQLTAYTMDKMLAKNRSPEEFRKYLAKQTIAVTSTVLENTTGLYAYVDSYGMFTADMDTSFNPQERPWYVTAMKAGGNVGLVAGYEDAFTNKRVISIVKLLADGKSVVAMDITLERMEKMLAEVAQAEGGSDYVVILDDENTVIAHSDPDEVGKKYDASGGSSFWDAIAAAEEKAQQDFFEINYKGNNYIVYTAPIINDWRSWSIQETTSVFAPLKMLLAATIVVVLVMVLVLGYIMEKSNRQLQDKLNAVAASKAKSSFLSNMSHEIRTPINAILGMNEMILRECDSKNILTYAANVETAGTTLLSLVNDILDFSKIEAGKMEIIPVEYDLSSLLNDLVNMVGGRAEAKGLSMVVDFNPGIPAKLFGDGIRLKQVITNLLTNAVKYTERGIVTFHVDFVQTEPGEILLKVAVEDTGIGIKEEDLPKLFAQFERIEEARNSHIEGTGLGMSITQRLLAMMDSYLEVSSTYGKGSVFRFAVRQGVVKDTPLGDYKQGGKAALAAHKKYHEKFIAPDAMLLVVDDMPLNLDVFSSLLKRTQVQVDTADNGDKGIAATKTKKYDVIFLDHMMPGKNGIETLKEIRADADNPNQKGKIICLTANAVSGAREEYMAAGFDDYLTKPIKPDHLEEMLMHLLPTEKVKVVAEADPKENSEELPAFLREIPEIDPAVGLQNCGSLETYRSTLKTYGNSVGGYATEIEALQQAGDIENATIRIHALKSTSRIIGAQELSVLAQRLEDAGKAGDKQVLQADLDGFLARCRALGDKISLLLAEPQPVRASRPLIAVDELREAYRQIQTALEDGDLQRVDEVTGSLGDYQIPKEEQARVAAICEAVAQFDYDKLPDIIPQGKGDA